MFSVRRRGDAVGSCDSVAVQAVKLRSVDGNQANGMEVDQVEASTAALGIWLVLVPGILVDCSTTGDGRERS